MSDQVQILKGLEVLKDIFSRHYRDGAREWNEYEMRIYLQKACGKDVGMNHPLVANTFIGWIEEGYLVIENSDHCFLRILKEFPGLSAL